uniref:Shisa like 1a n=1 Tax=Astyanax mexicanus TaxID=7994 RepID=A0A8B9J4E8_ASTMX
MTMRGHWSFNTLAIIFLLLSTAVLIFLLLFLLSCCFACCSNYTALIGVWIYGFFVMVLLALDFLYYSAMNYELCRVYLEKWGLGGRWLKQARIQWHGVAVVQEGEVNPGTVTSHAPHQHHHPRHSLTGEAQSPTLMTFQTSTAW